MSRRDFNNNTGNITDIYTNSVVSSLHTKSDVNILQRSGKNEMI